MHRRKRFYRTVLCMVCLTNLTAFAVHIRKHCPIQKPNITTAVVGCMCIYTFPETGRVRPKALITKTWGNHITLPSEYTFFEIRVDFRMQWHSSELACHFKRLIPWWSSKRIEFRKTVSCWGFRCIGVGEPGKSEYLMRIQSKTSQHDYFWSANVGTKGIYREKRFRKRKSMDPDRKRNRVNSQSTMVQLQINQWNGILSWIWDSVDNSFLIFRPTLRPEMQYPGGQGHYHRNGYFTHKLFDRLFRRPVCFHPT
jgi:hypothetical protein